MHDLVESSPQPQRQITVSFLWLKKGGTWDFSPHPPDSRAFLLQHYTGLPVRKPGVAAACDLAQGSAFLSGEWVDWINNNSHHLCARLCSTFYLSHVILTSAERLVL